MHVTPILVLLLQLAAVLGVCRLVGYLAIRLGQPRVVGEMAAGIMLGPSLLGWLAPGVSDFLFPAGSVRLLNVLAQIGVILFLFLIGLELDPKLLRKRGHAAVVISHMSIVVPLLSGAALTIYLYPRVFNDSPTMHFTAAALFIGAAMSVTAFPVLARILTERRMLRSKVGALAITCAAIDDVTAWCMLAFVLAIARAEGLASGVVTALLVAVYVLFMIFAMRPALRRLEIIHEKSSSHSHGVLAIVLLLVLLSAAVTEFIGIHALFGAFLVGAIMPKESGFVHAVTHKLEDFTITFLLPIFFAYAGLRTQIGLLDNWYLWGLTGLVVLTACAGKFGGSLVAGLSVGLNWRESAAIGILMNTRGLMELVILTLGLQMGVITDAVFAMMVIMALVTTAMTTPVLHLVYPPRLLAKELQIDEATAAVEFGVVVPVARPETGPALARVLSFLGSGTAPHTKVYGLALSRPSNQETLPISPDVATPELQEALRPLLAESEGYGFATEAISFPSRDVASDIARVARHKRADLILMGFHKPVIGHAILGGTVHRVLTGADADVAVFVDRGMPPRPRILVPYQNSIHDRLALQLALRMAQSADLDVTILEVRRPSGAAPGPGVADVIDTATLPANVWLEAADHTSPIAAVLQHAGRHDLAVVGLGEEWGLRSRIFGFSAERIAAEWPGSLLLVRKHLPLPHLASDAPPATAAAAVH